jgi:hypothetical protein
MEETIKLTSLKMIDPCVDCPRDKKNCHNCGFLDLHFRFQENKSIQDTLAEYNRLHPVTHLEYVPHDHGSKFDDCRECNEEINGLNPGKHIDVTIDGRRVIIHICNSCYIKPEFQAYLKEGTSVISKISNY